MDLLPGWSKKAKPCKLNRNKTIHLHSQPGCGGPSQRFQVWNGGPFTEAFEQASQARQRSDGLEWGANLVVQVAVSGLAGVEQIPNLPNKFDRALSYASQVKNQPTTEGQIEAIKLTSVSLLDFILTAADLSGSLMETTAPNIGKGEALEGAASFAGELNKTHPDIIVLNDSVVVNFSTQKKQVSLLQIGYT